MILVIKERESAGVSYQQVVDLLHESFRERLDAGLHYSASSLTVESLIERTKHGYIYVAFSDEGVMVGVSVLNIKYHRNTKFGYFEYCAVKDGYKHCGIGTALLNYRKEVAISEGCEYILSDTSIKAESAIKYHLRNGFEIVGYESFRSTNYWSYVFRMQLLHPSVWDYGIYRKISYCLSFVFIRLTRTIDGRDTFAGKVYKKLVCKN